MRTVEVYHELTGAPESGAGLGRTAGHPSLVLCSATAQYEDHGPWVERAASVRWVGTAGIASEVVAGWFTPDWAAAHPEFVEQTIKMIGGTPDDGYAECCTAIACWDGRRSLAGSTRPRW